MERGRAVVVRDFFGEELRRVIVEADDRYVFVCTTEEWEAAKRERRDPVSVGFLHQFVVSERAVA